MVAGFLIYMLLMAFGQHLRQRAASKLDTEEKARVLDASQQKVWTWVALAALLALFFSAQHLGGDRHWLFPTFLFLTFAIAISFGVADWRRLKLQGLPENYMRSVKLEMLLRYGALLILIGGMLVPFAF
jgi:hypothetical protein